MANQISLKSSVRLADDVLIKQVDDSAVLLNLKSEAYFGLDASGYDFLSRMLASESLEQALHSLSEDYECDSKEIEADFLELLANLYESGLIVNNETT